MTKDQLLGIIDELKEKRYILSNTYVSTNMSWEDFVKQFDDINSQIEMLEVSLKIMDDPDWGEII